MSQSYPNRLIVDPLDGTTNFLHGIPHFAVSIALERDGQVVAAVVLDVAKQELYRAELGAGAWLGDKPLRVSQETAFERSLVGTGIPHHGNSVHDAYLEALASVMRDVAGVRRMGAAALDLAYVAAGRFEAFFELGLAPWDLAGGILLVREAGGVVSKTSGEPVRLDDGDVLAITPALHPRMLAKWRAASARWTARLRRDQSAEQDADRAQRKLGESGCQCNGEDARRFRLEEQRPSERAVRGF